MNDFASGSPQARDTTGFPFVAMVEPADFGPGHDPSGAGGIDGASLGRVLAEREVRSRALVD